MYKIIATKSTFRDDEEDGPAPYGEELETCNRKHKAQLTIIEDVQNCLIFSRNFTVNEKTPEGGNKDNNLSCNERLIGTAYEGSETAIKTPQEDMELSPKTPKEADGLII